MPKINKKFYPKEKTNSSLATMKKKSQNMTRSMKVRRPKMKGPRLSMEDGQNKGRL